MEDLNQKEKNTGRLKFIVLSLIGIVLFLIPLPVIEDGKRTTTLPIAFLAKQFQAILGPAIPWIILLIIIVSGILTILCSTVLK
ncbi:hypothetical protein DD924_12500, partial [Staphylococcus pseudintermedius]